jgi:hypothetical protein
VNNRIKELADKASQWVIDNSNGVHAPHERWNEKFAELIVKDMCVMMEMAEDDAFHCFDPSERPTEYIDWLNQWQTKFEKHFGVE